MKKTVPPYKSRLPFLCAAGLLVILIIFGAPVQAWLGCERSFHFLGKTAGDTCTISFWEVAYGECESWRTHHLIIGPNGLLIEDAVERSEPPTTPLLDTGRVKERSIEWIQRLQDSDSVFQDHFAVRHMFSVRPPVYDSSFWPVWRDTLNYVNYSWEAFTRHFLDTLWLSEQFDPPLFDKKVELVYRYPGGLYKNYEIIDVIYTGGYFFILTQQPVTANELTFDGVLVYRLIG
jgi:hypothetical protein